MGKPFTERWQSALEREAGKLLPPEDQLAFVASVKQGLAKKSCLIATRGASIPADIETVDFPWADGEIAGIQDATLVARLPQHEAGDFYMLDGASVFMAQSFANLKISNGLCIDVCAAPGGKTVLLHHYHKPERIVANETIRKRFVRLEANVKRCGLDSVECTSMDTARLSETYSDAADLVVVDAPCSGQALFARGETSSGAFSKHTMQLNMKRQRRILSESMKLVRKDGYLCYMTCTYSLFENEKNVLWFLKSFENFEVVSIPGLADFQSTLINKPAYRLWPQQGYGSGGFTVCFRRFQ